ncbi:MULTISPECIES: GIDE domain-containing protein [Actinoalloteichus]|uniref:RING-type E3 ubiquitin transferase n=1 Tax=Actinoalloteichus fjordicus TaxID=1612552 RepID=A0AAC9LIT8_9PSEU|nr:MULTISPECIES: GIDE domain-containing protein [Actinoalloteichus]APU17114.1 E3 Ubiquitin ligase [Actinoalloteichus fjordicus]APU23196.1 E3 Ubiquitin ligase [Actinoalloteichus sp. GBA129-24]
MIFIGIGLLLVAVIAFFGMSHARSELHAMIAADTLPVSELKMLRKASDDVGGQGTFRKECEVVGVAEPLPTGPLSSELTSTECVWFRYRIEREYEHVTIQDNRRQVSKRTEQLAEHSSPQGYAIRDDAGELILVEPGGLKPDKPEQTLNSYETARGGGGGGEGLGSALVRLVGSRAGSGGTIGHRYTEWVVRPGQRLYVLGEVNDRRGELSIAKPEKGHFIISTRSEDELRAARTTTHKLMRIGIFVAVPLGIILIIAGAVG